MNETENKTNAEKNENSVEKAKFLDRIPQPVKYGVAFVGGVALTVAGVLILGKDSHDIPADVVVDAVVRDVVEEGGVETGEF